MTDWLTVYLILFGMLLLTKCSSAKSAWIEATGNASGGYRYAVWMPKATASPKAGWPLVIWLHGFSLRGDDLSQLKRYGLPAVLEQITACNFLLVAPQLPANSLAWDTNKLNALFARIEQSYAVDPDCVALIGASLGGSGAYQWAAKSPDRFTGMAVLAGAANPRDARALADIPLWIMHGADDKIVPVRKAHAMEMAIRAAGGQVRFTELPGIGHDGDALTREAFLRRQLVEWLLAQRRSPGQPVSLPTTARSTEETRTTALRAKGQLPSLDVTVQAPDNARIFAWISALCATPHRRPGTPEGHEGEAWVARQFEALGLRQVTSDHVPIKVWQPATWQLRIGNRDYASYALLNSGFTPEGGVTAPMKYVGEGQWGDFHGAVKGKIVVAQARVAYHDAPSKDASRVFFQLRAAGDSTAPASSVAFPSNMLGDLLPIKIIDAYERAKDAGAVGFLMLTGDLRSQGGSFYWPYDALMKSVPGLYVANRDATAVQTAAKAGRSATLVQTGAITDGYMANVWGVLPGASEDVLLITSHHDSPHRGAVEDASGVAQVLAQAWAWSRVPQQQRPLTLVFVAAGGHFLKGQGAYAFAKAHPEIMRRCRAVLTLEHMPCKEVRYTPEGYVETGRTQPVTIYMPRNPALVASVWHALERRPPPFSVTGEYPLLGITLSDAAGYIKRSTEASAGYPDRNGVPYVSWISTPLYLVDAADTTDYIDRDKLSSLSTSVTEVVKQMMLLPAAGQPSRDGH